MADIDTQHMAGNVCRQLKVPDTGYARMVISNALMDAVARARSDERAGLEHYFSGKGEAVNWSGVEVAAAIRGDWDKP